MKPAPSQRAAEPASLEETTDSKCKPARLRTQQPEQLGDVTRRIVERLDRRRSRTKGVAKPKAKPSPAEQRKAAFHDPRQMQLPFDHTSTKDKSHGEA